MVAATATAIIRMPCIDITWLYRSALMIVSPGRMSSMRINIAEMPPRPSTARNVTPYWMPMTLWSMLKRRYRRQPVEWSGLAGRPNHSRSQVLPSPMPNNQPTTANV